MNIELTKQEIGCIVVALSRYVKRHECIKGIDKQKMTTLAFMLRDLADAAKLASKMDAYLVMKDEDKPSEE